MKAIIYSEIVKQAFEIAWKNKFLWVFGLLVSLGSGISNINLNMGGISSENEGQLDGTVSFIQQNPEIATGILITMIFLIIIFFSLRIIANAGIIKTVSNINVYSQSTVKGIFLEIKKYFWPLVSMELLIGLAVGLIILTMLAPILYLFSLKNYILGATSLAIAVVIIIPLIILACFIRKYASFYIVVGNMKIKMAIEYAYGLFKKNIKESLLMGIAAIFIGIITAILTLAALLLFILLFALLGFIAYIIFAKIGLVIILIIGIIAGIIFLLLFSSAYAVFIQAVWILFFQEISLEKKSKIALSENIEAKNESPAPEII